MWMRLGQGVDPAWRDLRPGADAWRTPGSRLAPPEEATSAAGLETLVERYLAAAPPDVREALLGLARGSQEAQPAWEASEAGADLTGDGPAEALGPDQDRLRLLVSALTRDLSSSEAEVGRLREELDRLVARGVPGAAAVSAGLSASTGRGRKKLSILGRIVDENLRLREETESPPAPGEGRGGKAPEEP